MTLLWASSYHWNLLTQTHQTPELIRIVLRFGVILRKAQFLYSQMMLRRPLNLLSCSVLQPGYRRYLGTSTCEELKGQILPFFSSLTKFVHSTVRLPWPYLLYAINNKTKTSFLFLFIYIIVLLLIIKLLSTQTVSHFPQHQGICLIVTSKMVSIHSSSKCEEFMGSGCLIWG